MTTPMTVVLRLVRAWLVTGVTDALFSSALVVFAYGSTVTRLWQGVAAVPLGASAFDGGTRTAAIGVLIHFGVAFGWTAVFFALVLASSWLRGVIASTPGVIAVAVVYGPIVWLIMSLALIPLFTHRPPVINFRWWVQFAGHIPFVALPIVALLAPIT